MDQNEPKNQLLNMREQFRSDIRRRDQESFFKKKRLQYIQQQNLPEVSFDQLLPKIQECIVQKNIMQLGQLHLVAFKFIIENQQNEDYLLRNQYLDLCVESLKLNQFDCFRTLINLSLNPLFLNTQVSQNLIQVSLNLLNQQPQQLEYILLFLANVVSLFKMNLLQLLPNLLLLSEKAEGFLLIGLVYLLSSIIEFQQINANQKQIGIKLVLNALKKEQTEECLMPLAKLYDQTFDQMLLESNCFEILVNHECQMLDKCLAIVKQFTLSDSLLVANKFIDLKILDKLQLHLNHTSINIKKEVYLILANLSYNDFNISSKIINHPILVKIINNIVTTNEKKFCMSVILNLQATGNEQAAKKLLELGLVIIICNLLDIAELSLIQQFLDSILRLLQFQNIKELLNQQNFKLKLEKIYQEQSDQLIQELCTKIVQLF